jgi:simple sugar transport system ATP-binding protein
MHEPVIPAASDPATAPAVEAAGIHKRFGRTHALRGVDLSLQPARCLGLVGRNGAGKSTLVSILSGIYPPDAGEVRLDGQPAPSRGDIAAWRERIATVFQHSMVVPGLTVAEQAQGVAILYISHHLEEVFEICTDVAVLRDGKMALTAPLLQVTKDDLVTAMVGEKGIDTERSGVTATGRREPTGADADQRRPALVAEGITYASPGVFLGNVSLTIHGGERVGVTGLRGSGATTLARIVAGAAAADAGQVRLGGRVLRPGDRAGALRAGIGYIPEDRQADGFVPLLGAAENITMTITDRIARSGFVGPRRREARAAPLARRLSLVSAGLGQPVRELSGGNQQKVTVARALASDPVLIVAITPTRGVDVASKELLPSELDRITTETAASLLLASDELDDLAICDRVVVLVRGESFTEFTEPPFDREALIAAAEGLGAT